MAILVVSSSFLEGLGALKDSMVERCGCRGLKAIVAKGVGVEAEKGWW